MTAARIRYRDHSVPVESTTWLPLPPAGASDAGSRAITVSLGPVADPPAPTTSGAVWRADGDHVVVDVSGVGKASIDGGWRIVVDNTAGADEHALGHAIASTVLTTAAVARGGMVLHATILRHGDRTVALTAPSRTGKSTLAVALEPFGVRVHADDGCHVDADEPGRVNTRGWAPLRLLPDAAAALGADHDGMRRMPGPPWKGIYEPDGRDDAGSARLDALLFLERGDVAGASVERVGAADAVPEVVRSLYLRGMTARLHGGEAIFAGAVRFVAAVPVLRLRVPDDLTVIRRTAAEVFELVWGDG